MTAPEESDCDLVDGALTGRPEAFGKLVERYDETVRRIIRRFGEGWESEEDDLAQQVMLTAYQKLEKLEDCRRFESWLWGITSRICWKWGARGRKKLAAARELTDDAGQIDESLSSAERLEIRARVADAIASLPEEWQPSVLLRYLDALSYREVAAVLGESEGKVRARISRGSGRLREKLVDVWRSYHPEVRAAELPGEIEEILAHDPGSVMVIADDYSILAVSNAYSRQTGYAAAGVAGRKCYEVSHGRTTPCDGSEHPCPMALIGNTDRQVSVVHMHQTRGGGGEAVDVVTFPVDETIGGKTRRYFVERLQPVRVPARDRE